MKMGVKQICARGRGGGAVAGGYREVGPYKKVGVKNTLCKWWGAAVGGG